MAVAMGTVRQRVARNFRNFWVPSIPLVGWGLYYIVVYILYVALYQRWRAQGLSPVERRWAVSDVHAVSRAVQVSSYAACVRHVDEPKRDATDCVLYLEFWCEP